MEDAEAMRQMVIAAVNDCKDNELLDLIYRLLSLSTDNGGDNFSAVILLLPPTIPA